MRTILCVTGPMAAGKNAAAAILERKGFFSIDADLFVHEAVTKAAPRILEAFAEPAKARNIILTLPDGSIDRRALGRLIFPDPVLLAEQESIVYPVLTGLVRTCMTSHADRSIILNATVLYKTPDLMNMCSRIVYIDAPAVIRFFRAKTRDRMKTIQILQRFHSQADLLHRYTQTGIPVSRIMNTGNLDDLEQKLNSLLF